MPRKSSVPSYRLHKASGQARTIVNARAWHAETTPCASATTATPFWAVRGHFRSLLAQFGLTLKSKRGLAARGAL